MCIVVCRLMHWIQIGMLEICNGLGFTYIYSSSRPVVSHKNLTGKQIKKCDSGFLLENIGFDVGSDGFVNGFGFIPYILCPVKIVWRLKECGKDGKESSGHMIFM